MRLVDDDRVVALEESVALDLREQDPVGHDLDEGAFARVVGEAHLVADSATDLDVQLLGDAIGDGTCRDAPRLRVADLPGDAPAELEQDLGQLRRLAAAGLARDHDHLVVADGRRDVVAPLADREVRVGDGRDRRTTRDDARLGAGDVVGDGGQVTSRAAAVLGAAQAVEPSSQAARVAQHDVVESRLQLRGVDRGRRLSGFGHGPPRIGA